jgi:hypothetical protein
VGPGDLPSPPRQPVARVHRTTPPGEDLRTCLGGK